MAQDRVDIMFATKEICRKMASPDKGSWKKLTRLARYLISHKRMLLKYNWQGEEE